MVKIWLGIICVVMYLVAINVLTKAYYFPFISQRVSPHTEFTVQTVFMPEQSMAAIADHMITKPHFDSAKISHKEFDITAYLKTASGQTMENTIDKLLEDCFYDAFCDVHAMLDSNCLEQTEVPETTGQKSEPSETRQSTETTTTTVTAPLPDLVPIPPDLVLRGETRAVPQSFVIEPVSKSHVQFTLIQVDEEPQLDQHKQEDVDNFRQTVELHQQKTNEINAQSCMQTEKFACLMFEEAWSDAMRKVCVCLEAVS